MKESPYDHDPINRWNAPTPGNFGGRSGSPSNLSYASSAPSRIPDRIPLLGFDNWREGHVYDEQPPSCIHYSILWKVTLNGRTKLDDTEQDLVLAPSCYWERFLKPKLETVVAQKFTRAQRVQLDDTNITVSINDRSEDKLSGTFPKLSIDWSPIENQLLEWANLFVAGKKLKLIISFKYIGDSRRPPSKGDKRGTSSATERMQAELEGYLEAGRSAGLSDDWRHVYQLMRCRGKSLVDYVKGGGILRTERDIPEWFHEQLKAENQQPKTKATSCPSFNIVLPGQTPQPTTSTTTSDTTQMALSSSKPPFRRLNIPGPLDRAVRDYGEWHASQWVDEEIKADYRHACDVVLENGLHLEQIHNRRDLAFKVLKREVRLGTAYSFVDDLLEWVENRETQMDGCFD